METIVNHCLFISWNHLIRILMFTLYCDMVSLNVSPDDAIFRSIKYACDLKYGLNYVFSWKLACAFSWILEAHMLHRKASSWQWESRAIFHLIGCVVIRLLDYKKKKTLNYTENYVKTRVFGNKTLKIVLITYWEEIPPKNINLKSFRAEQFFLGKF